MCTDISTTACAPWHWRHESPFAIAFRGPLGCRRSWNRELSTLTCLLITVLRTWSPQIVHLIFKRTETRHPFWLFVLLFAIPACLTLLYVSRAQGSAILATVKVFTLFWSTLTTSILVYRVSPWHPLAKYPGPLICKLTKFYLGVFALGGKQYLYYFELHRKYGDVVRIGLYSMLHSFDGPSSFL